jgi:cytoskeletal protein RodZ
MEFFHGIVALLAGIVLVLTGLVAWLYIQQSRMSQAINALAVAVTAPPVSFTASLPPELHEEEQAPAQEEDQYADMPPLESHDQVQEAHVPEMEAVGELVPETDDRVSVHEEVEEAEVQTMDAVDVSGKTVAELRQLLTERGIPFNKSDKKTTLISLVQVAQ